LGIKVRPNGFARGVPKETTIQNIGAGLKEVGEYGFVHGVEVWLEVHGSETQLPPNAAEIMRATNHKNVGLCWNSNPTDVVNGSVKQSFDLLRPWLKSCHINELTSGYPYKELFGLMRKTNYDRWTLCECAESKEPERFLKYYRALWRELAS
jgi:sugar phosphate isomerase/epimerase